MPNLFKSNKTNGSYRKPHSEQPLRFQDRNVRSHPLWYVHLQEKSESRSGNAASVPQFQMPIWIVI